MTKPITDIKLSAFNVIPTGYLQVPVDLNWGARGSFANPVPYQPIPIHINYHRRVELNNVKMEPVTGITVVAGKNSPAPLGWYKDPNDLNWGSKNSAFVYLCWKRGGPDLPICDLVVQASAANFQQPPFILEKSYTWVPVDLNKEAGGMYIYLYYLQDEPGSHLQEDPPDLYDMNTGIANWINNPKKEYELSRAQVTFNRLLVHTLKLVIELNAYVSPNMPFNEEYIEKHGVKASQTTSVSKEISYSAGVDFSNWGIGINTKLGYTKTETYSYELSVEEERTIGKRYTLEPVNFGRQLCICHVADVITVYDIPSGNRVAEAVNATTHRGDFIKDQESGPFQHYSPTLIQS
jgi:hypothetical protein